MNLTNIELELDTLNIKINKFELSREDAYRQLAVIANELLKLLPTVQTQEFIKLLDISTKYNTAFQASFDLNETTYIWMP